MTRLAPEERTGLASAYATGWLPLLAYVTELVDAYHAAGLVEGDLGHDGTIRAEAEAEADPYDKVVFIQGHRHSEPVCAWPNCATYLTRPEMAALPEAHR